MIQSIIADYRYEKSFTKLNNQLNKSIKDDLSETGTFWILCKNSFKKKEMEFNAFKIAEFFENYCLRQEVLEAKGWTFFRIWSTDWNRDPIYELNQLDNLVKTLSTSK